METVGILLVTAAIVVAAVIAAWPRQRGPRDGRPVGPAWPRRSAADAVASPGGDPTVRQITLDIVAADTGDTAVERMVTSAARSVFGRSREVEEVIVRDRVGNHLGSRRRRPEPLGPLPPALPPNTADHHPPPRDVPTPVRGEEPPRPSIGEPPDPEPRSFADRHDLPAGVRRILRDPDDPLDVVRAILEAAGRPVERRHRSIVSEDTFLTVLGSDLGPAVVRELNNAFLAYRESGARRGLVISLHALGHEEVHRREILAPDLRHAGPDAIQAMADAATLGGDPIAFAVAERYGSAAG